MSSEYYYLVLTSYSLLLTTYSRLLTTYYCLLLPASCVPLPANYSRATAYCVLLTTYYLLRTTCYLLFTLYYLLRPTRGRTLPPSPLRAGAAELTSTRCPSLTPYYLPTPTPTPTSLTPHPHPHRFTACTYYFYSRLLDLLSTRLLANVPCAYTCPCSCWCAVGHSKGWPVQSSEHEGVRSQYSRSSMQYDALGMQSWIVNSLWPMRPGAGGPTSIAKTLLTTLYSLLTTHYSLLTTPYTLLTTH